MSEKNRRNEYNRLMDLGREADISAELKAEFGTKEAPKPEVKEDKPKPKKEKK